MIVPDIYREVEVGSAKHLMDPRYLHTCIQVDLYEAPRSQSIAPRK